MDLNSFLSKKMKEAPSFEEISNGNIRNLLSTLRKPRGGRYEDIICENSNLTNEKISEPKNNNFAFRCAHKRNGFLMYSKNTKEDLCSGDNLTLEDIEQAMRNKEFSLMISTNKKSILLIKEGKIYYSRSSSRKMLGEILPENIKNLLSWYCQVIKLCSGGGTYTLDNGYSIAFTCRGSRAGNLIIYTYLVNPEGEQFPFSDEVVISAIKLHMVRKTLLYNIQEKIKCYEYLVAKGVPKNLAVKYSTDSKEIQEILIRKINFLNANSHLGIDHNEEEKNLILRILIENYSQKSIENAIGFIGEPIEPEMHYIFTRNIGENTNLVTIKIRGIDYKLYINSKNGIEYHLEHPNSYWWGNQGLLWVVLNRLKDVI